MGERKVRNITTIVEIFNIFFGGTNSVAEAQERTEERKRQTTTAPVHLLHLRAQVSRRSNRRRIGRKTATFAGSAY